jgi:hypothetical protein
LFVLLKNIPREKLFLLSWLKNFPMLIVFPSYS